MKLICILVLFLASIGVSAHPLHVTISNIDFSDDSVQVSIAIDGHGLEDAIEVFASEKIIYENLNVEDESLILVSDYLANCFKIIIEEQIVELSNWKVQIVNKRATFTSTVPLTTAVKKVTIENTLFLNMHGEARNMLILSAGEFEKGIEFNNNETKKTITLVK